VRDAAGSTRFAIIDIGTVTTRLLVADCDSQGVHDVVRRVAMTHLGEGLQASGRLSEGALERVAATLDGYRAAIAEVEARDGVAPARIIAVATSAARDAENAAELVDALAQRGIELAVIPGELEAAFSFSGTISAFPEAKRPMVVDIGGGSTEVSVGIASERRVVLAHSFDIGCRRVTDLYLPDDPPTTEELAQARAWIRAQMHSFFDEVVDFGPDTMLAVAGTATSMVSVRERMEVYDSARVHRARLTRDDVRKIGAHLAGMTNGQRAQVVGLEPGRAGVIVAGTLILDTVMELAGFAICSVSESDIMQGIALDAYDKMMA